MAKKKAPQFSQLTKDQYSEVEYNWIVVFSWDVDNESPFEIYQKNAFSSNEIPEQWYTKKLTPTCRHQKLKLSGLRGDLFSVFCKIQACK